MKLHETVERIRVSGQEDTDQLLELNESILKENSVQFNDLICRLQYVLDEILHLSNVNDMHYRDLLVVSDKFNSLMRTPIYVKIEFPIANESNDHINPRGTINDNIRHSRFVLACERHFPDIKIDYIDLGCAGGGIV
ncbi:hypothetical protein [Desulfovibrio sp. JC022]|uniref:hypothetical protein n=1 Tax=Desulfovibrio sp. JC022 TaxID=2593642 RepID=UPI0013CF8EC3|nr:hypothetical protein [Desulfovibrio sp. JC022]NDV24910.1 hypothetical protein [Desulfovibrio sp. JC022]